MSGYQASNVSVFFLWLLLSTCSNTVICERKQKYFRLIRKLNYTLKSANSKYFEKLLFLANDSDEISKIKDDIVNDFSKNISQLRAKAITF